MPETPKETEESTKKTLAEMSIKDLGVLYKRLQWKIGVVEKLMGLKEAISQNNANIEKISKENNHLFDGE